MTIYQYIQRQIKSGQFDGLVSMDADCPCFCAGANLGEHCDKQIGDCQIAFRRRVRALVPMDGKAICVSMPREYWEGHNK